LLNVNLGPTAFLASEPGVFLFSALPLAKAPPRCSRSIRRSGAPAYPAQFCPCGLALAFGSPGPRADLVPRLVQRARARPSSSSRSSSRSLVASARYSLIPPPQHKQQHAIARPWLNYTRIRVIGIRHPASPVIGGNEEEPPSASRLHAVSGSVRAESSVGHRPQFSVMRTLWNGHPADVDRRKTR
jgi:hypothetical protein